MTQSSMLPTVAAHPSRPHGPVAPARILRSPGELLLASLIWLLAFVALYFPAAQVADLGPLPDATEYATTADRLAHFHSFAIELLGKTYPSRYPFGFPLLLVPSYWLPGATLANG